MATVTPDIMQARVPVFASLTDAQLQSVIDEAYLEMNEDVWGVRLDVGAFYLAAHKATVNYLRGASAGAVQSESVGQVSRSYFTSASNNSGGSTSYQDEFNRIRDGLLNGRFPICMGVDE